MLYKQAWGFFSPSLSLREGQTENKSEQGSVDGPAKGRAKGDRGPDPGCVSTPVRIWFSCLFIALADGWFLVEPHPPRMWYSLQDRDGSRTVMNQIIASRGYGCAVVGGFWPSLLFLFYFPILWSIRELHFLEVGP